MSCHTIASLSARRLQKEGVAGADGSPRLAQLGAKILVGFKAMHVMSGTGAGRARLQGLAVASAVLQNAMQDRAVLLAKPQRRELEGLVGSSKVRAHTARAYTHPGQCKARPIAHQAGGGGSCCIACPIEKAHTHTTQDQHT